MNTDFEVTVRKVDFSDPEKYRTLILPKIYEELSEAEKEGSELSEQGYICLAAYADRTDDGATISSVPSGWV